jgi:DNA replication and repair protein RecF
LAIGGKVSLFSLKERKNRCFSHLEVFRWLHASAIFAQYVLYLKKISLLNFKNHPELDLELGAGVNCFLGPNGVGKTNLLDAVHYLSLCKSYFHAIDQEHILHDKEVFMIKGVVEEHGEHDELLCSFQRSKGKTFKRNKKSYQRLADHIGRFPVVMITPFDSNLILDGSDVRRRSLDGLISQFDKAYLEGLVRYNKALAHRNQLLKRMVADTSFSESALEPWNDQLSRYAEPISRTRQEFMGELIPLMNRYYKQLGHSSESIGLEYRSQLGDASMVELLRASYLKDRAATHTTVGVHKDDLMFTIGGRPLKRNGSQGQQKTFLLALKLAHFEMIAVKSQKRPVLLLDDVFDKIDPARMKQLLHTVTSEKFGQVLITDTDPTRLGEALQGLEVDVRTFQLERTHVERTQTV